jgi:hypothetical protein
LVRVGENARVVAVELVEWVTRRGRHAHGAEGARDAFPVENVLIAKVQARPGFNRLEYGGGQPRWGFRVLQTLGLLEDAALESGANRRKAELPYAREDPGRVFDEVLARCDAFAPPLEVFDTSEAEGACVCRPLVRFFDFPWG